MPGKQAYSAYVGRYMPWNVSHLSPAELDICDEWLIRITSTDSPEAANDISSKVERAYLDTGETDWEGDVLPVRDPKNFDRWLVVVDANRGRSTKIAVEVTRKEIFDKYPEHDSLRRYLKYAEPFEWSLTDYQRVYGKPDNLPQP